MYFFKIAILLLFICLQNFSSAQNFNIDSLEAKLDKVDEKEKVEILNILAVLFQNENPQQTISYANVAYELSKKHKLKEAKVKAIFNLAKAYEKLKNNEMALNYYEQIFNNDKKELTNSELIFVLQKISDLYKSTELNKSILYTQKILNIYKEQNRKDKIILTLIDLSKLFIEIKDYNVALNNLQDALKIENKFKDKKFTIKIFNQIGINYFFQSEYEISLEKFREILTNQDKNKKEFIETYYYISQNYQKLKELDSALFYANRTLELSEKHDVVEKIKQAYNLIANIYLEKDDYKKVYKYLNLKKAVDENRKKLSNLKNIKKIENLEKEVGEKEIKLEKLKDKQSKNINFVIVVIMMSVVIIVFAIISITNFLGKKKKLTRIQNMLKEKDRKIREQKSTLDKLRITHNNFFAKNVIFIKKELNDIIDYSEILTSNVENLNVEKQNHFHEKILNSAKESYNILNRFLDKTK